MPAGRPTIMTKEVLRKLEDAYLVGATNFEAATYAGISETLLYEYKAGNSGFVEKIEKLKGLTGLRAKINLDKSITAGDENNSKWWLERKDKEFKPSSKQEVTLGAHKSLIDAIIAAKKGES